MLIHLCITPLATGAHVFSSKLTHSLIHHLNPRESTAGSLQNHFHTPPQSHQQIPATNYRDATHPAEPPLSTSTKLHIFLQGRKKKGDGTISQLKRFSSAGALASTSPAACRSSHVVVAEYSSDAPPQPRRPDPAIGDAGVRQRSSSHDCSSPAGGF